MDLGLPGYLPYEGAYLSTAEVESFAFCSLEVFHILLPLDLTVPSVVAPHIGRSWASRLHRLEKLMQLILHPQHRVLQSRHPFFPYVTPR